MNSFKIPGVVWVGLIAAIMVAVPQMGFDPMITGLVLVGLGAVAKGLQVWYNIPDEEMPDLPEVGGVTPAASPYAAPKPEPKPQPSFIQQLFLG